MDRPGTPRSAPPARPTRQPTRLAFHATRIIVDIGVLVVLGAMSLPFVSSPVGDRSAITADALPTLLLLAPVFLVTLLPDHTRPIPTPFAWISLVLGAAAFPYSVVKFLDAASVADTVGGTVGLGARLLVLGSFVTLVGIGVALARGLMQLPTGGAVPGPRPEPRAAGSRPQGRGAIAAARPSAASSDPGRQSRAPRPQPRPGGAQSDSPQRSAPRPDQQSPRSAPASPPGTQPRPGAGPDRDRSSPPPRRPAAPGDPSEG